MKKIILLAVFAFATVLQSYSQISPKDGVIYVKNKEDITTVTLYYDSYNNIYRARAYFHTGAGAGLHYFVFDRNESDYWYYRGTRLDYSPTTCEGEYLCVGRNGAYVKWGNGSNTKVFNIKSSKEEVLAYERRLSGGSSGGSIVAGGGYNNGTVGGSNNNSTSGSSNRSLYTTCKSCNGTGICSSCRGQGGKIENTGYYAGNGSQSWINCGSCSGSGKCPICYGRGKL